MIDNLADEMTTIENLDFIISVSTKLKRLIDEELNNYKCDGKQKNPLKMSILVLFIFHFILDEVVEENWEKYVDALSIAVKGALVNRREEVKMQ